MGAGLEEKNWFNRVIIRSTRRRAALSRVVLAVVAASLAAAAGPDGVLGAFLGALMLAIAASDFRRYIIPNELTGAALALALLRAWAAAPEAGGGWPQPCLSWP